MINGLIGAVIVLAGVFVGWALYTRGHRHRWVTVHSDYRPGQRLSSFESGSVNDVRRLLSGETIITEHCDRPNCRAGYRQHHLDGDVTAYTHAITKMPPEVFATRPQPRRPASSDATDEIPIQPDPGDTAP